MRIAIGLYERVDSHFEVSPQSSCRYYLEVVNTLSPCKQLDGLLDWQVLVTMKDKASQQYRSYFSFFFFFPDFAAVAGPT